MSTRVTTTSTHSDGRSSSKTVGASETKKVLDEALLETILSGLSPLQDEESLLAYARSLLTPALETALEGSRQTAQTKALSA